MNLNSFVEKVYVDTKQSFASVRKTDFLTMSCNARIELIGIYTLV